MFREFSGHGAKWTELGILTRLRSEEARVCSNPYPCLPSLIVTAVSCTISSEQNDTSPPRNSVALPLTPPPL